MISRQNLPRTSQLFPAKNTVRDKIVELLILFRCEDPRATSDLTVLSRMKAIVFYTEKKKKEVQQIHCEKTILLSELHGIVSSMDVLVVVSGLYFRANCPTFSDP